MYKVFFAGLTYFDVCSAKGPNALFPNGTKPQGDIPRHYASLFIEGERLASDDWWDDQKHLRKIELRPSPHRVCFVDVFEFRIAYPAIVTFSGDQENAFDPTNLDRTLIKLQTVDTTFEPDPSRAIAQVPVRGGTLGAFKFGDFAVVQWTIERHSDPITITADASGDSRKITLRNARAQGEEIVFSNTPDLISKGHDHGSADHFSLYSTLSSRSADVGAYDAVREPDFSGLDPLLFRHDYLEFLTRGPQVGSPKCSGTCC